MDVPALVVAAIDIGTKYTGYAFSSRLDPNSIFTSEWRRVDLLSYTRKAPTSVLLNQDKEFLAFGYDADLKYMENLEICESDDSDSKDSGEEKAVLYCFRRFKLALLNKSVDMDTLITDESGLLEMKAFDIFTFAIRYIKEQIINHMKRTLLGVDKADIHYVLTVPAIWDDNAKVFMRKSAEKAGIQGNQVTIALESEVASVYCRELRTDRDIKNNITLSEKIMKYVVVDLGDLGETADIAVHQQHPGGFLEEVVPPSGGALGSIAIDDAFLLFLENVFGTRVMKELKLTELEDYEEILHSFEYQKRWFKSDRTNDVVITMPVGLINIIKKHCGGIDTAIKKSPYSDSISVNGQQRLCVNPQKFRNFFKPTINSLLKHLEQLFQHPKVSDIQDVIMVGIFSEYELVQKEMKDKFPKPKRRYKLFVVAIDFGTTYSGYAFSTKSQPNSIYTCDWRRSGLLSYKAPTTVLLNHKKEFLAFGYDAETKYMSSLENDSDDEDSEEA